jgi:hypothetical protein
MEFDATFSTGKFAAFGGGGYDVPPPITALGRDLLEHKTLTHSFL